jgi:cell division protein FtsW
MPDRWILYSIVLLFLMGETAIISANVLSTLEFDVQTLKRPVLQLVAFFAGLLLSFYIAKIDYKRLFKRKVCISLGGRFFGFPVHCSCKKTDLR